MALLVSVVPLSLTIVLGLPRPPSSQSNLRDPDARDRSVGDEYEALAAAVVDH
jgi:hypothetical protein